MVLLHVPDREAHEYMVPEWETSPDLVLLNNGVVYLLPSGYTLPPGG